MADKPKRGLVNNDSEIDDGYEIPGDASDFPIFKFTILIIVSVIITIFTIFALTTLENSDKSPNPYNMLKGCFSLIADTTPDGMDDGKNDYYLSSTVRDVYAECIKRTELEPYNKETDQVFNIQVVAAYAVGCLGPKIRRWEIEDDYRLGEFTNCMKNSGIGWRQSSVKLNVTENPS